MVRVFSLVSHLLSPQTRACIPLSIVVFTLAFFFTVPPYRPHPTALRRCACTRATRWTRARTRAPCPSTAPPPSPLTAASTAPASLRCRSLCVRPSLDASPAHRTAAPCAATPHAHCAPPLTLFSIAGQYLYAHYESNDRRAGEAHRGAGGRRGRRGHIVGPGRAVRRNFHHCLCGVQHRGLLLPLRRHRQPVQGGPPAPGHQRQVR